MDTRFFENTTMFRFTDKNYYYNVSISTEYIIVSAKGNLNNEISIKKRFLRKPWPRSTNSNWLNSEDLHDYLKINYEYITLGKKSSNI